MLHILRHGKAERDARTGRDEDRELAPRGHRQAAWQGARLAALAEPPTRILASRAPRARTTAELVAEALGLDVDDAPWLFLGEPASNAYQHALALPDHVLLVGHEPVMSTLIDLLLHGPPGKGNLSVRTGECIDLAPSGEGFTLAGVHRLDD